MSNATKEKQKPLYHSNLRETKTTLQVRSGVKEGQYGPYCFVRLWNAQDDRLLNLENPKVAEAFQEIYDRYGEDTWVVADAAGTRDSAAVFFEDADGAPLLDDSPAQPNDAPFPPNNAQPNQPAQPAQPAQPSEADTAALKERQEPEPPKMGSGNAKTFLHALESAHEAMEAFRNKHGFTPSEEVRRVATTIFINLT